MKPLLFAVCLFSTLLVCCNEIPVVPIPASATDVLLQETKRLTPVMRSSIEGVYSVLEGNDVFGDQVALKWSYVTSPAPYLDTTFILSVFSGKEACYFAVQGGTLDSVFLFSGYWRKTTNTETGIAKFTILSSRGGRLLFQPTPDVQPGSIVFTGEFGSGDGLPNRKVTFKYERPLYKGKRVFEVLAHRGGGRTSDMLPVSENTVDMILFTPRLGSTALEIDVRLTKDNKLILYHDKELNSRLTQPTGLVGTVEEYTYAQLQAYVRLIHGERIPLVEEVLDAAYFRTPIRLVYLDNKASSNLAMERELQKKYIALSAAPGGRKFDVLIGIPSDDKQNEFLALSDYADAPSLNELSMDDARKTKSHIWVPRFTLGPQPGNVAQWNAESPGNRVFTWTMDVPTYIEQYMAQSDFDGMVTNYAPMVAYYHYTRQ